MSKNTSSNKFRKVDVDQFDPDKFVEESVPEETVDNQEVSEAAVNNFLAQFSKWKTISKSGQEWTLPAQLGQLKTGQDGKSKNADALKVVLDNTPQNSKNQAEKDRAVQLAVRVMTSFKTNEIDPVIKSLSSKDLDALMKYIYRGFEYPADGSSASLLTWHEKAFAAGGLGTIVRVLTDRKRF